MLEYGTDAYIDGMNILIICQWTFQETFFETLQCSLKLFEKVELKHLA